MAIIVTDVIDIETLRQHIELDVTDRDALIKIYAQAALDYCLRWCDEPRWKLAADIPAPIISATLLVFGDLFEHRTEQSEIQLYSNAIAESLMFNCRNWRGTVDKEE
ncbi:hypothetical protein EKN56_12620 [Limnobaculum zhutongyuii]|uniref:Phage gp6-like head-tail connector protein n=1 Tax=Limnobaculum zhutongyuii TaxID=2498113 RepID=A0A411WLV5_9GAMM|nr:head-tail connector protein [Limnobaculum zhutongyuii]QBH97162.1 hypothetical protein EKN56_12620 [Limnobaculum zhutongyuii]TQS88421.1 hypothetical protein ELQ32_10405 [Limnobaculum zhutongyuii]